jgi:hypothetical protein
VTDALEDDDRDDDVRPRKDFPLNERDAEHLPRRYTRAKVAAQMDELLASMEPTARFQQQLNDCLKRSSLAATIKGADFFSRYGNDFLKNSGVLDVIKATEPMMKLAGEASKYAGRLNVFKGVDVARVSGLVKDFEPPTFRSGIDWESYVPESLVGSSTMELPSYLELPPNPAHETNARVSELIEILRAEREDHQRDREHAAAALAAEKRKLARQRAAERIRSMQQRRATIRWRWFNGASLAVGIGGIIVALVR